MALPPPLTVLTCGSVDDGKSTLVGRLMAECGRLPPDVLAALQDDSRRWGTTGGVDYALLVDGLAAEREQGITIDIAWRFLDLEDADGGARRIILADAPGHAQYTRNMATGASVADVAVLLVDARQGLQPQTRRHAAIAALMGVRQVVLAVNKMDLVDRSAARFAEIAGAFAGWAARLELEAPVAIPMVAREGGNIARRDGGMGWYDGPTLVEVLGRAAAPCPAGAGFRLPVQWVARPDDAFRGFAGTVLGGVARPGMAVRNVLAGTEARIARIVTMDGDLEEAAPGDAVTLVLDREIDASRGDVLATGAMPHVARHVTARLVWMDEAPLFPGRSYLFQIGTRLVPGTVDAVESRMEPETLDDHPARQLEQYDIGRVAISFAAPVAFEPYRRSRALGGFTLIDRMTHATAGAGMIETEESAAAHVHWHSMDVDKAARAALKHQRPAVLWFTGLSGTGKSTIANLVERALHGQGRHSMLLDGDNLRHGLNRGLGFSPADRVENIRRVAEVAKLFVDAGLIVLVSFISPYRSERMLARERVEAGEFLEIFVDTPIEECRRRDPKGLYARADAGRLPNFTGVDAPYEPPEAPDIHLRTLEGPAEAQAERVLAELRRRGVIG